MHIRYYFLQKEQRTNSLPLSTLSKATPLLIYTSIALYQPSKSTFASSGCFNSQHKINILKYDIENAIVRTRFTLSQTPIKVGITTNPTCNLDFFKLTPPHTLLFTLLDFVSHCIKCFTKFNAIFYPC